MRITEFKAKSIGFLTLRYGAAAVFLAMLAGWSVASAATFSNRAAGEDDPVYNTSSVVSLDGMVQEVRQVIVPAGLKGVHITVKCNKNTVDVYLGPADFVKEFNAVFKKGDQVEIVGSKVKADGSAVVLAREVRRDDSTLYLRDHQGHPFWRPKSKPTT
jgi:hypothetical protein